MTDTPLLRLARLVESLADQIDSTGTLLGRAVHLVRDLEAAPFPDTGLEPRGCPTPGACSCPPPAPARRTITRAEFEKALEWLAWNNDPERDARGIAAAWRLTVEDA